jgi:hypothetical protein
MALCPSRESLPPLWVFEAVVVVLACTNGATSLRAHLRRNTIVMYGFP